jgi:hypothetical protein
VARSTPMEYTHFSKCVLCSSSFPTGLPLNLLARVARVDLVLQNFFPSGF